MTLIVYLYGKCSTCKDALKFLQKTGKKFEVKEITQTTPSNDELKRMLKYQGGELRKLFNTSGLLYREMGLSAKLDTLSTEEAFHLLKGDGMLIKRPFLLSENFGLQGFKEAQWSSAINAF